MHSKYIGEPDDFFHLKMEDDNKIVLDPLVNLIFRCDILGIVLLFMIPGQFPCDITFENDIH